MMWREDMPETFQVCGMICRILQIALQPLDFHAWHLLHICSISSAHGDEVLSQLLLARLACNVAFLGEMTLPRTRLLQVYRSYQKWSKLHCALHRSEKIIEDHVGPEHQEYQPLLAVRLGNTTLLGLICASTCGSQGYFQLTILAPYRMSLRICSSDGFIEWLRYWLLWLSHCGEFPTTANDRVALGFVWVLARWSHVWSTKWEDSEME